MCCAPSLFFFHHSATTEIYTLSLHDALPIWARAGDAPGVPVPAPERAHRRVRRRLPDAAPAGRHGLRLLRPPVRRQDRKSTRLNSSHPSISYAVFCLKKKNKKSLNQYTSEIS